MNNLYTLIYESCLSICPDESVALIFDSAYSNLATHFWNTGKLFTQNIHMVSFSSMSENGQEPPENVRTAMMHADIALLITTYSLSHTKARMEASARGTRIISMPGITEEILNRSVDVDYADQAKRTDKLTETLTQGTNVRITSSAGTDVRFSIDGRTAESDTGYCTRPGDFINLPAGEAFVAPVETTAEGTIVFDGAIASIPLDAPIVIQMKNGAINRLTGGTAATEFLRRLNTAGEKSKILCEFGIGTNVKAIPSPEILEAEKAFGTCHLAFGRNISFGGINDVPFHTDGLIMKPTIQIDNSIIMKEGVLL